MVQAYAVGRTANNGLNTQLLDVERMSRNTVNVHLKCGYAQKQIDLDTRPKASCNSKQSEV